jgi:hypothetical protein
VKRSVMLHLGTYRIVQHAMKETMIPVNTAEPFQTTRTVAVRDATVLVTEIGIERNHNHIQVNNTEAYRDDAGIPRHF